MIELEKPTLSKFSIYLHLEAMSMNNWGDRDHIDPEYDPIALAIKVICCIIFVSALVYVIIV